MKTNDMKKIMTVTLLTCSLLFTMGTHSAFGQSSRVQQGAEEHHRQPRINPLNPNLIAYEQGNSIKIINREEGRDPFFVIQCDENFGTDVTEDELFGFNESEENIRESSFDCAYFDWRPVLDPSGRYWFAYTSTRDRTLNVGYVQENTVTLGEGNFMTAYCKNYDRRTGETYVDGCDYFTIYRAENRNSIFRPKWSPDGQHLLVNEGSDLYMTGLLTGIVRKASPENVEMNLIAEDAFFPEWSPNGRYIAYEYNPSAMRQRDGGVEVQLMEINDYQNPAGSMQTAMALQDSLLDSRNMPDSQYKPSWSTTGSYLSYIVPGVDENLWNVKVDTVGYHSDGEIDFVDSASRGQLPYIASNVFRGQGMRSGYPVVSIGNREVLVSIRNDQETGNPIQAHALNLENIRTNYRRGGNEVLSDETVQNNHLDVYFDGEMAHVAYVSQVDGSYSLQTMAFNANAIESEGVEQSVAVKRFPRDLSPRKALFRSAMLPGLGQFYKGERKKGFLYLGVTVLAAGSLGYFASKNSTDYDEFQELKSDFKDSYDGLEGGELRPMPLNELQVKYANRPSDAQNLRDLESTISTTNLIITASAVTLAGIYVYSVIDSRKGFPVLNYGDGNKQKVSVTPQVQRALFSDTYAGGIKLNINFN